MGPKGSSLYWSGDKSVLGVGQGIQKVLGWGLSVGEAVKVLLREGKGQQQLSVLATYV